MLIHPQERRRPRLLCFSNEPFAGVKQARTPALPGSLLFHLIIESLVDLRDLGDPSLALAVFEREELIVRPVKVICNVRYLLIEPL